MLWSGVHVDDTAASTELELTPLAPGNTRPTSVTLPGRCRHLIMRQVLEQAGIESRCRRRLLQHLRQAESTAIIGVLDDGSLLDGIDAALRLMDPYTSWLRPPRSGLRVEPKRGGFGCLITLSASILWWERMRLWSLGSDESRCAVADVIARHRIAAKPCEVALNEDSAATLCRLLPHLPADVRGVLTAQLLTPTERRVE